MPLKVLATDVAFAKVTAQPIFQNFTDPTITGDCHVNFTQAAQIMSVRTTYTSVTKAGTRQLHFQIYADGQTTIITDIAWVSTGQTASQTLSYESGYTAETVNNVIYCPAAGPLLVSAGGSLRIVDSALTTIRNDSDMSGTATASDATTMTNAGAAWVINLYAGYVVTMGGSTATIISNTATVLTFAAWSPINPTTGAYTITGDTADLEVVYVSTVVADR